MPAVAVKEPYTLVLREDDDIQNPRADMDNFGTMTCFHSRYNLGDSHEYGEPNDFLLDLVGSSVSDNDILDHVLADKAKSVRLQPNIEDDTWEVLIVYIPIVRHTRVRMDANPYLEPEYFTERRFKQGMKRLSGRFKLIWKNQNGCCHHCGQPMEISDEREIFFKVPKSKGGKDEVPNMAYVHKHCQTIFLERCAKA